MPITWDARNKRWRFQFNRIISGRRHRASRLLPSGWSRDQAEAYDREQVARLYAVASGIERPIPLISEAVRLYLDHRVPQLANAKACAQSLALLLPDISGHRLDELADIARKYAKAARKADGAPLAPATLRNRLAYLRAAVRYAHKHHGLGDRDYSTQMAMPKVDNARHVYLRPDELRRLLSHVGDDETRALIRLAFYTALRWVKELLPRQPEDVQKDGANWWLTVPDTKTGKPLMVWLHPACRRDLSFLPFRHHWRTYYARFEAAKAAAGMPHLHMHDLRHSLASVLISQGATLSEVGGALGHRSHQSTARYAHLYPERVAAVVRNVPTINATKARKKADS